MCVCVERKRESVCVCVCVSEREYSKQVNYACHFKVKATLKVLFYFLIGQPTNRSLQKSVSYLATESGPASSLR